VVVVSEEFPRRVRGEEAVASDEIGLEKGQRALLTTVRREIVGNEKRRQTAAGAAAVDVVATREEFADAAGRDEHQLSNNDMPQLLDRTGLSLRVPPVSETTNDSGLYGFYPFHQALLQAITTADAEYDLALPDDERTRRALGYAGAELIAEQRVEDSAGETGPDRDGDEAVEGADHSGDDEEAADLPSPEESILGYDWVSTDEDRRWSGRPLRALLYTLLTESGGAGLPADAVNRVELINYGEPKVKGYEVPAEQIGLTLESDAEPPDTTGTTHQYAVDFRVVGDLGEATSDDGKQVEDYLEQHLNAIHLVARYKSSMRGQPVAADRPEESEEIATNGVGEAGISEEAARRKERLDLEVPFERVPEGLWKAMEDAILEYRNGKYKFDVSGPGPTDEIIGSSHSWQKGKPGQKDKP
jgi:hypothetical protein